MEEHVLVTFKHIKTMDQNTKHVPERQLPCLNLISDHLKHQLLFTNESHQIRVFLPEDRLLVENLSLSDWTPATQGTWKLYHSIFPFEILPISFQLCRLALHIVNQLTFTHLSHLFTFIRLLTWNCIQHFSDCIAIWQRNFPVNSSYSDVRRIDMLHHLSLHVWCYSVLSYCSLATCT